MNHAIVSREEWLQARTAFLAREKEFTRMRDELSAARRALPWVRVEKPYAFETERGTQSLAELFGDKSQLAVYHLMFGPEWEASCKSCAFWADSFNGISEHLAARDIAFVAISRAPLARLQAFAERLGWRFRWVSSRPSDFNADFGVTCSPEQLARGGATYNYAPVAKPFEERPGVSVFHRDERGAVFHTYSTYGRGIELMNAAYQYIDLTPKGRDEGELPYSMAWVRHRDQYGR